MHAFLLTLLLVYSKENALCTCSFQEGLLLSLLGWNVQRFYTSSGPVWSEWWLHVRSLHSSPYLLAKFVYNLQACSTWPWNWPGAGVTTIEPSFMPWHCIKWMHIPFSSLYWKWNFHTASLSYPLSAMSACFLIIPSSYTDSNNGVYW